MARERKTHAQQEDVQTDVTKPVVQASEISGLARQGESTQHKESFHHFVRALAREIARVDHSREG